MRHRRIPLSLALAFCALSCTAKGTANKDSDETELAPPTFTDVDPGKFKFEWRAEADEITTAPVSLTASDGTGLQLVTMDAKVVLEDPLAFTELTLTFHNPEDRVREGHFEINLPVGAAISRFSMLIGDRWQEAEVVETQAARVAYEDFLHRRQDPALLEKKAGNQFRARVFPIPAKGNKQLKISFSQELRSSKQPYHMLLAGLPRMQEFTVDVAVVKPREPDQSGMSSSLGGSNSAVEHLTIRETEFAPRADLEVRFEREVIERGLRHEDLVVGRIAPVLDAEPAPIEGLTILLDTSASRALGFEGQIDRLTKLIAELAADADFPLELICFDQTVETVYQGQARGFGADARARIMARKPLGASDLAGALTKLGERELQPRVLLVTDGIVTAGAQEHEQLRDAVGRLARRGALRLDALVDGGIQDELTLKALTTGTLPQHGVVASARLTTPSLAGKLESGTHSKVAVAVEGAEWVWPETLDGVQPGDEVLVYAKLPANAPMIVELREPDQPLRRVGVPTRAAQGPLLQRAWTRAKIDRMTAQLRGLPRLAAGSPEQAKIAEQRRTLREDIIALSTRERVMSDFTSLLVLETEADYRRFGIDRTALADILTVGPGGIEVIDRRAAIAAEPEPPPIVLDTPPVPRPEPLEAPEREEERREAPADAIPQMARDFDPDSAARHAGEEGRMGRPSGSMDGAYAMAPPPPGQAVGNDGDGDDDVWGGLAGSEVGEAYGVGGLGLVGTGRGGGGTGEGEIGLGNTGLIGRGGGGGSGSGYGRGSGAGFGGRGRAVPQVRQGQAEVEGALDRDIIRRIVRAHINEVRACYNAALTRDPTVTGRISVRFVISSSGSVGSSVVAESTVADSNMANCVARAVKRWRFPRPRGGGEAVVTYPFSFDHDGSPVNGAPADYERFLADPSEEQDKPAPQDPWEGRFAEVMQQIGKGEPTLALSTAWQWRESEPGSELALLALGEAAEANDKLDLAARAYGSLIDLFPSRADLRRMAGQRLERVAAREGEDARAALDLAVETYRAAVEQRPDHPSSHRLYAYALVKAGRHEDAFAAILAGVGRSYPGGRFAGVDRILREDAGLIAAAWIAATPNDAKLVERVRGQLSEHGLSLAEAPSTRFVLNWETDANDVDFHIYDSRGGHAFYSNKTLASGGELYADVTTGYGPECFTIPGTPSAGPYKLQAHYYSMGPMGYGMGKLEILRHDGKGGLTFEERPFVIMRDHAFVDLGQVK